MSARERTVTLPVSLVDALIEYAENSTLEGDELPEFIIEAHQLIEAQQSFNKYRAYVDTLPIVAALWWFIENITPDDQARSEWFFYLRDRYRTEVEV